MDPDMNTAQINYEDMDTTQINYEISIEYTYEPSRKDSNYRSCPCVARITTVLPLKGFHLIPELQSATNDISGACLTATNWKNDGHRNKTTLSASTWEDLADKVDAKVRGIKNTLKVVYLTNRSRRENQPNDRSITVTL